MPPVFEKIVLVKTWKYEHPNSRGGHLHPHSANPANRYVNWEVPEFVEAITVSLRGGGGGAPEWQRIAPGYVDTGGSSVKARWHGVPVVPGDVITGTVGENVWDDDPLTPGLPGGGDAGGVAEYYTGGAGGGYTQLEKNGDLLCIAGGAAGWSWLTNSINYSQVPSPFPYFFDHGSPEPSVDEEPRVPYSGQTYEGGPGGVRTGGAGAAPGGKYAASGGGGGYGGGAGGSVGYLTTTNIVLSGSSPGSPGGFYRPPFDPEHPDTPIPQGTYTGEWIGGGDGIALVEVYWHHYAPYVEIVGPESLHVGRNYTWDVGESQSRYEAPLVYEWKIWPFQVEVEDWVEGGYWDSQSLIGFGNQSEIEWRPTSTGDDWDGLHTIMLRATDHEGVQKTVRKFVYVVPARPGGWSVGQIGYSSTPSGD